jgi:hypothetical protein
VAIFLVRACKVIPGSAHWIDNTAWRAQLITNRYTDDRDAVAFPPLLMLNREELLKGFVAFPTFQQAFDIPYPALAEFCLRTAAGPPIAPMTHRAMMEDAPDPVGPVDLSATIATNYMPGPPRDPEQEGRARVVAKDAMDTSTYKGMCTPVVFARMTADTSPVWLEICRRAVEYTKEKLPNWHNAGTSFPLFLKGLVGSDRGVTHPHHVSVIDLFGQRKEHTFDVFLETMHRTSSAVLVLFGVGPHKAFEDIKQDLFEGLLRIFPESPDTLIGITGAIDIINDVFYRVAYNAEIRPLDAAGRWHALAYTLKDSRAWKDAVSRQVALQLQATIDRSVVVYQKSKGSTPPTAKGDGAGTAKPNTKKRPLNKPTSPSGASSTSTATAGSSSSASTSTSSSPGSTRCRQQDLPGGCTFGLGCIFEHDASTPKSDANTQQKTKKKDD